MVLRTSWNWPAFTEGDTMSTAVIGATGRVGSEIVRGLLARGDAASRPTALAAA